MEQELESVCFSSSDKGLAARVFAAVVVLVAPLVFVADTTVLVVALVSASVSAVFSFKVFGFLFVKSVRIFETKGIGQTQAQKARPKIRMSSIITMTEMTALGIIIFVASMVVSAPIGQISDISKIPGADKVPIPNEEKKPRVITRMTPTTVMVRSVFDFMISPYPYTFASARMTMARSVASELKDAFFKDTHTLSQAPQPLHLSSITEGRLSESSSMAS